MTEQTGTQKQYSHIIAGLILVGLLILGCFVAVLIAMHQANEDSHRAQMFSNMAEYRIALRGKLDSDMETLEMMAEIVRYNESMDADLFLDGLVGVEEELLFDQIGYFSADGKVSRAVLSRGTEDIRFSELRGELQQAVRTAWSGENAISPVYYDQTLGRMTLTYAVPIYTLDGQVVGALTGSRSLKVFATLLNEETLSGAVMNIDWVGEDGTVYTWSRYSILHERISNLLDGKGLSQEEKETLSRQLKSGEPAVTEYPVEEGSFPLYIQPLGINGWSLVFLEGQRDTVTPVYDMLAAALVILILLLALCIGVLFFSQNALRKTNLAFERTIRYDKTGALRLESFLAQVEEQTADGEPWCLALLTLPRYDDLCVTFGHEAGEAVVNRTAKIVAQSLVDKEIFCRVRDCEFGILFSYRQPDLLRARLEEILDQLQKVENESTVRYPLYYRIGAAGVDSVADQKEKAREWYRCAGIALRRDMEQKKARIQFFNGEMYQESISQREREKRSLSAVEQDEFRLCFLPKTDLKTGAFCGAQAFARWELGEGESLEPDQYLSLFEAGDRCAQLDLYLFEKLCAAVRGWLDQGLEPLPVTIRQTRQLFYQMDYPETLEKIRDRYRIPRGLLGVDIPMDVNQEEIERVCGTFSKLHRLGFLLSLNDYTTALHLLGMDTVSRIGEVKLRADLYKSAEGSPVREQVVQNVVEAASRLGVRVVVVEEYGDQQHETPERFSGKLKKTLKE